MAIKRSKEQKTQEQLKVLALLLKHKDLAIGVDSSILRTEVFGERYQNIFEAIIDCAKKNNNILTRHIYGNLYVKPLVKDLAKQDREGQELMHFEIWQEIASIETTESDYIEFDTLRTNISNDCLRRIMFDAMGAAAPLIHTEDPTEVGKALIDRLQIEVQRGIAGKGYDSSYLSRMQKVYAKPIDFQRFYDESHPTIKEICNILCLGNDVINPVGNLLAAYAIISFIIGRSVIINNKSRHYHPNIWQIALSSSSSNKNAIASQMVRVLKCSRKASLGKNVLLKHTISDIPTQFSASNLLNSGVASKIMQYAPSGSLEEAEADEWVDQVSRCKPNEMWFSAEFGEALRQVRNPGFSAQNEDGMILNLADSDHRDISQGTDKHGKRTKYYPCMGVFGLAQQETWKRDNDNALDLASGMMGRMLTVDLDRCGDLKLTGTELLKELSDGQLGNRLDDIIIKLYEAKYKMPTMVVDMKIKDDLLVRASYDKAMESKYGEFISTQNSVLESKLGGKWMVASLKYGVQGPWLDIATDDKKIEEMMNRPEIPEGERPFLYANGVLPMTPKEEKGRPGIGGKDYDPYPRVEGVVADRIVYNNDLVCAEGLTRFVELQMSGWTSYLTGSDSNEEELQIQNKIEGMIFRNGGQMLRSDFGSKHLKKNGKDLNMRDITEILNRMEHANMVVQYGEGLVNQRKKAWVRLPIK